MWPLAMWSLNVTVLSIPAVPIAALFVGIEAVRLPARCVLAAAVLSDLGSVYLDVTYLLRGGGVHGISLYAAAYYVVFVVFGMSAAWWWRAGALAGLLVLHVACQYYLPQPLARRLGWAPRGAAE